MDQIAFNQRSLQLRAIFAETDGAGIADACAWLEIWLLLYDSPERVLSGMSQVMVAVDSGDRVCGLAQWYLVLTWLSVYTCMAQPCRLQRCREPHDGATALGGQSIESGLQQKGSCPSQQAARLRDAWGLLFQLIAPLAGRSSRHVLESMCKHDKLKDTT